MSEPIPCSQCGKFHAPGAECMLENQYDGLNEEQILTVKRIMAEFSYGDIRGVLEIIKESDNPDSIISLPEVQKAAKQDMIDRISRGGVDLAKEIQKTFKLADSIISLPEVQEAAKKGMFSCLDLNYDFATIRQIQETFRVSEEVVQEVTKQYVLLCIQRRDFRKALKIMKAFQLSSEDLAQEIDRLKTEVFSREDRRIFSEEFLDYQNKK